jgi:integrase
MTRRAAGEGSVYQRSDGRWEAVLSFGVGADGRRRRKKKVRSTQREAAAALREMSRDRDAGCALTSGEHQPSRSGSTVGLPRSRWA